jgi:UDP-N-acetylglucosamine 2-epimerase (non-hydrolysing)
MKVLTVFGTRPEAIKLAPVVRALEARAGRLVSRVCVTGQHREMLTQVLRLFEIKPDYDLEVMESSQTPTRVASGILAKLEPILVMERPDWVLVQGDTTTAAAVAMAAFYARAKVGHVEAGLRSYDKWQPFPEEINRRIVGATADLHFAPTQQSADNLLREGIRPESVVVTGNTVIDALHWVAALPARREPAAFDGSVVLERLDQKGREQIRTILVTAHRRENFGAPLQRICEALEHVALQYAETVQIIYPVHLNPNVCEPVRRLLGHLPNVILTDPLDYFHLVQIMKRAYLVLTDSGGIQEEAPGLGKPVLVLREVTERPEGLEAGTVRLVGTATERIIEETARLLDDPAAYRAMAQAVNPYGDGHAAARIVSALLNESIPPLLPRSRQLESQLI